MEKNAFILGDLAYYWPEDSAELKSALKEIRQQLPPQLSCYYGDRLSHGQFFWGADFKKAKRLVIHFAGPVSRREPVTKFSKHEFLKSPTNLKKEDFGVVMETGIKFSYQYAALPARLDRGLKESKQRELYVFDYHLDDYKYRDAIDKVDTDCGPSLKKVFEKLGKNPDILELNAAWNEKKISIALIRWACQSEKERGFFLAWLEGLQYGCDFEPDLDSEYLACGMGPETLTLLEGIQGF